MYVLCSRTPGLSVVDYEAQLLEYQQQEAMRRLQNAIRPTQVCVAHRASSMARRCEAVVPCIYLLCAKSGTERITVSIVLDGAVVMAALLNGSV
jgi:hypothetical protein